MPYVTTSSEYRGRTVKRGKLAIWLGLSLVLGVLIVIGRNGYGLGEKHSEPSRLSAVMATVGPVRDINIAKGAVAYDHQFVLRSQIAGKVIRLTVKEGDEVVRGQHLLCIVAPHEEVDLDLRRPELQRGQAKSSAINKELTATRRLVGGGGFPQYELDQKILERDTADNELQQVRLEISPLHQTRDLSSLKSPVKRLLLSMLVEIGQLVNTGDELISLAGGASPYIIAVARALITNPTLLIADEPTVNLDSSTSRDIMNFLRQICDDGKTVVMVTHDATFTNFLDRVVELSDGRVCS